MEGLVLKYPRVIPSRAYKEAPRGGAGIEIAQAHGRQASSQKPLVEGLVLK